MRKSAYVFNTLLLEVFPLKLVIVAAVAAAAAATATFAFVNLFAANFVVTF